MAVYSKSEADGLETAAPGWGLGTSRLYVQILALCVLATLREILLKRLTQRHKDAKALKIPSNGRTQSLRDRAGSFLAAATPRHVAHGNLLQTGAKKIVPGRLK